MTQALRLETQSKPGKEAGCHDCETIGLSKLHRGGPAPGCVCGAGPTVTQPIEDGRSRGRSSGAGSGGGLGCAQGRCGLRGALRAARMVLTAAAGARVVPQAASLDALGAPLLAGVEGQRQGVLGHVGLEAITADAAVGEGFLEMVSSTSRQLGSFSSQHTGSQVLLRIGPGAVC